MKILVKVLQISNIFSSISRTKTFLSLRVKILSFLAIFCVKSNLFQFSILSTFQNFDFQGKKMKILVKVLQISNIFSSISRTKTFLSLRVKILSFLAIFCVKSNLFQFSILSTFQNLDFQGKKWKSWWKSCCKGGPPFSLPKFGNFHFLNLVRGSEIWKYKFSDNHGNKLSGQLRKTALYLTPQAI